MSIIDDQALDAVLDEQLKQQVLAFAPMSTCSQAKCGQQEIPQCRFFGIIFRGCHRQYWIPPSTYHPRLTAGGTAQVADAHGLAGARLRDNHMPAPQFPRLTQESLKPILEGGFDEAIEERQRSSFHRF